jgi:hypothetical protein
MAEFAAGSTRSRLTHLRHGRRRGPATTSQGILLSSPQWWLPVNWHGAAKDQASALLSGYSLLVQATNLVTVIALISDPHPRVEGPRRETPQTRMDLRLRGRIELGAVFWTSKALPGDLSWARPPKDGQAEQSWLGQSGSH